MVRICIRMLQIPFEGFDFGFECFKSLSNDSNPFRMVRIFIQMLRILFEWLELGFECFKSLSNGSNLHSNANDTINGELCLCKKVPDFTKLCLIKGQKTKFPVPGPPSLPHALHTNTYLIPNNPYNLILPPLGQKAERNPWDPFSCERVGSHDETKEDRESVVN